MADTTSYTFSFAADAQGWVGYPVGKVVYSHEPSTGYPGDGCMSVSLSSKNENPGDTYMEWIGTWEELGVPSGSNSTEIGSGSLNDYNWRVRQYATVGANAHAGPFRFYDTGGNLIGTFSSELAAPAGQTTWVTQDGQAIAVPSSLRGSTQQIALRMYNGLQTGNSNSAVLEFLIDQIGVTISYSAGGAEQTLDENETNLKLDGSDHPDLISDRGIDSSDSNLDLDGSDHPLLEASRGAVSIDAEQSLDGSDHPTLSADINAPMQNSNYSVDGSDHPQTYGERNLKFPTIS